MSSELIAAAISGPETQQPERTDRDSADEGDVREHPAPALRGGQSLMEHDREDEEREAADHEDPAAGQDRVRVVLDAREVLGVRRTIRRRRRRTPAR